MSFARLVSLLGDGSKYETSPRPPQPVDTGPARLGKRLSANQSSLSPSGRWRPTFLLKLLAALLLVAISLQLLYSRTSPYAVYRTVRSSFPSPFSNEERVAVTMLSPTRHVSEAPPPVQLTLNTTFYVVSGVVMSQRTTWQEGGRTPYHAQFALYMETTKVDDWSMHLLARVNATYTSYPDLPPVPCRPFHQASNSWPLMENLNHDQPPHWLECDIPESIAPAEVGPPATLSMRLDWAGLQWTNDEQRDVLVAAANDQGVNFTWPVDSPLFDLTIPAPSELQMETYLVPKTTFSICLVPFWGYESYVGKLRPHRFIEWRLYWKRLGVDRVVWYAYEGEDRYYEFVKLLIGQLDVKDELHIVKRMPNPNPYWDQPLYYNHCQQLYRAASDYIIVVDLDEVITLAPSDYADPATALKDWVDSWPADVGGYKMIRVDMSMEEPTFRRFQSQGRPSVALLAQDIWTAIQPTEEIREVFHTKTIYRAKAVFRIWTHYSTWMYPHPVPLDEPLPMLPATWPKPFHSPSAAWKGPSWPVMDNKDPAYWEVWPRMIHYRWWGGYAAGEIGSELWPTNEVHERFKDELREEVLRLGEVIAKKMGLP